MRFVVSVLVGIWGALGVAQGSWAQAIVGQGGTIVNSVGSSFEITGGVPVDRNLFHSFTEFGLSSNQTAIFQLTDPNIANVFSRVMGGNPSFLDGKVAISGSASNFYLMNPAGIIFGKNFQFPTLLSLTATTANGMAFGNQWWSATGVNNYATLGKVPTVFGFTTPQPAAIINRWASGSTALTLVGGTVISPADVMVAVDKAIANNLTIVAVPGNNLVRITSADSLLGLEIRSFAVGEGLPNAGTNSVPSLAQLITGPAPGGGTIGDATGLSVNPDGQVFLSGASVSPGDVYTGNLTAKGILIGAPVGNVTVATIEVQDLGVQVTAGQRFRATGSRLYDNVQIGSTPAGIVKDTVRASIAVLPPMQSAGSLGQVVIQHGGGAQLSLSATTGFLAVGQARFVVGGVMSPIALPVDASGTVNAIVLQSSGGTASGLAIAYANQTFGGGAVAVGAGAQTDVKLGGVGGLSVAYANQTFDSSMDNQDGRLAITMSDPLLRSSAQSQSDDPSCRPIAASPSIVARRSTDRTAVSANCATEDDDTAILKILE
jgi:filamentous hemagglutinin family protein